MVAMLALDKIWAVSIFGVRIGVSHLTRNSSIPGTKFKIDFEIKQV